MKLNSTQKVVLVESQTSLIYDRKHRGIFSMGKREIQAWRENDLPTVPEGYHDLIREKTQKILASADFDATDQQRKFLRYVVDEVLAGRADDIKGYNVATRVFGRTENFDASIDPIVSIQANKLRRALERYYLLEGKTDPIVIDIPKGTYIPTFLPKNPMLQEKKGTDHKAVAISLKPWPILQITPFRNSTGDPEKDYVGIGISAELANEISQFDNFRVYYSYGVANRTEEDNSPRFVLEGEVCQEKETIKLFVSLVDAKTNIRVWSDICSSLDKLPDLYSFKDKIVRVIALKICGDFGVLPRIIRKETRNRPPRELSTYEAILRFWEFDQMMTPESLQKAFYALTHAIAIEPDCSQTLVSLAILYCTIYNLDIEGFEDPLGKASFYAEKAATINPNNQRVLVGFAYARMTSGELSSAIHEANLALNLNPESLFMLDGIGWLLTLCGDWERGPKLAQKAINLNPCHREIAHDALWLNYLRQDKFDLAYTEACSRKRYATLFWDSLIRSSTCGLMGKTMEGEKFARNLLALRPDFRTKGSKLISNFIKVEDIAEKILSGLRLSNLDI